MRPVWSVAEVRAAEAAAGVAEDVLIDRASAAVARRAAELLGRVYGARVLVAAGPGHNGADALWAGWRLRQRGAAVDVALPIGEPRDEHGAEPLRRLRAAGARDWRDGAAYDLRVDGVLGVGGRARDSGGDPPWLPALRDSRSPTLAVDVPTGLDADTGAAARGTVRATATVTFGRLKPGLVLGAEYAGLVEVAPIGLAPAAWWTGYPPGDATAVVWEADDVAPLVARPPEWTDKFRRGVVGVRAGSEQYPGAAALACRGAQRAGCGYVRLVAPGPVADAVRAAYPEVVAGDGGVAAWVVGPGLGTDERALGELRAALESDVPVVVDADGLTVLATHPELLRDRVAPTVLTPHTGEFERLTGIGRDEAAADRVGVTRRAARELGATVLLKGTVTVVSDGDRVALNPTGTPWLGTAGTGDVLSGVVGAFLSRGGDAVEAAAGAAWLHGLAGRLAAGTPGAAVTALDVAEHLPAAARVAAP